MRNGSIVVTILAAWLLASAAGQATAKIRVVASTTDLGSIASAVGGPDVEVQAIARSTADVHRVEVLPSYMVRVSKAQLYLKVGLGLDGWADGIIDGSRNARLRILDCSQGIEILEKPTGKVDARMGDIHPDGNPHYWCDPCNGAIVARAIAQALGAIDPAHEADFTSRAAEFAGAAQASYDRGREAAASMPHREIVTYHASWAYFAHAFDIQIPTTIEPIPGIPPTGKHLQEIVGMIRDRGISVVFQEPYFSDDASSFLARETGVRVEKVSPSCDSVDGASYLAHFDRLFEALGKED
jgi:ABC-type Zn uptake system ZnuABC Zn-binding protein ZnuA